MAEIIPGFTFEQKIVSVAALDVAVNAVIAAQAVDSWMVSSLILSGTDLIILFTRNLQAT